MKKRILKAIPVLVILAGAYLLRRHFILTRPQTPVVWDAAGYNIQGRRFLEAFQAVGDRDLFQTKFRQAYDLALPKGEIYPLFLSAVYALPGANFQTVRLAQAALGVLILWLLYLIAARVYNRLVALAAVAVSAVYPPYIFSEARLLTETVAIAILLATVWLLTMALESKKVFWLIPAGVAAGLLVVSRTFFQYSFAVFWALLAVGLAVRRRRWFFPKSLLFIFGLAVILVPRLVWTARHYDRPWLSGSWRNGLAMYCGIYPPNQGLQTDAHPGGEIFARVRAESERGAPIDTVYLRSYVRILLEQPGRAVTVLLSKGWLFWLRAYNDFLQSYLLSPAGIDVFTRVILLLGLWGLAASLGRGVKAWPMLTAAVYTWGMTFAADAESRYMLPAIPFTTAAGAWFVYLVLGRLRELSRDFKKFRFVLAAPLATAVPLLLAAVWLRPPRLAGLFPGLEFVSAFRLWAALAALALAVSAWPVWRLLAAVPGRSRRLAAAVIPPAFFLAVFFSALSVHPHWREWKVKLREPGDVVRQTILLPENLERYRSADLKLDLLSGPSRRYDLSVRIDGREVRRFERGLAPDPGSYIANRRAFPVYLREHRRHLNQVRQWYTVPLDIREFRGREKIEVEVEFIPHGIVGEGNWVKIWGDWELPGDPGRFFGPTFSQSPGELSLYRYLFDDDWRLWRETELHAVPVVQTDASRQIEAGRLSPSPSGRYRIHLLLSPAPPAVLDHPVAVRADELLTRNSILAHYYNLQVWEVNPWERKSDRMQLAAAHAAPGEAGGFQLVVYSDSTGDGHPDRLIAESPYFTADKEGEWSEWEFTTDERRIFVGMTWPRGSQTRVYYERARWPHELFPETMFYSTGPQAARAYPVITNLRLDFLPEE